MKEKKYFNIYKSIKKQILCGDYKPGTKLPSKRLAADKLGCSVITIEAAYDMLADEGYITSKERSGYYVNHIDISELYPNNSNQVELNYLQIPTVDYTIHDFEYSLWFKTIRKVIAEKGQELFIKSPNMGCAILRNAISDYLYRYRNMVAQPAQIIIGSGAEQLYEIVVKTLGTSLTYGIEDPSYPLIEAVYQNAGVNIKKLKMDHDGIASFALHDDAINVLHVTPFKSFPTDITVSVKKRYEYLQWASDGKFIVEDDFNSEFFKPGQPTETLYSLDNNNSVIYINTFSKSLSPSMRIGYMILPEPLLSIYEERLGIFSCSVPVLDQYILADYISSGNFERHLNRMRRKKLY